MKRFKENIIKIYGNKGKEWLAHLPNVIEGLIKNWHLQNIIPVENMSYHYVAKANTIDGDFVVLKIGADPVIFNSEKRALQYFSGNGIAKLIRYNNNYNALLLQQIVPGKTLRLFYPDQSAMVMTAYIETIKSYIKIMMI